MIQSVLYDKVYDNPKYIIYLEHIPEIQCGADNKELSTLLGLGTSSFIEFVTRRVLRCDAITAEYECLQKRPTLIVKDTENEVAFTQLYRVLH